MTRPFGLAVSPVCVGVADGGSASVHGRGRGSVEATQVAASPRARRRWYELPPAEFFLHREQKERSKVGSDNVESADANAPRFPVRA